MYVISDIKKDDLQSLESILEKEISDKVGKKNHYAIKAVNEDGDRVEAVIVFRIRNLENSMDTESEIICFSAVNKTGAYELLNKYTARIRELHVVRSLFEFNTLSDISKDVLEQNGFVIEKREATNIIIRIGNIPEHIFSAIRLPKYLHPVEEIDEFSLKQGIVSCLFGGAEPTEDDPALLDPDTYDKHISCCINMDGKLRGLLLVRPVSSGLLIPEFIFATSIDKERFMKAMFVHFIRESVRKYPGDTRVMINRHNDTVRKTSHILFPRAKGAEVYAGIREEGG